MLAQSQVGRNEASGNRRPREMVVHDRIRLTGLLRKKPRQRGFFYFGVNGNPLGRPGSTPRLERGLTMSARVVALCDARA